MPQRIWKLWSPLCWPQQVQLVVLVSAFVMVSTVWSVFCLLFFYSRCLPPCHMKSTPLIQSDTLHHAKRCQFICWEKSTAFWLTVNRLIAHAAQPACWQTQTSDCEWTDICRWPGSVVSTLVFGWRTFSDVWLIYGWHAATMDQPTRATQPFILSVSVNT